MSDILALANVESSYGPIRAIRGVSLAVKKGQIATVLGSNGAGKTTILKTISGILDPSKGTVHFKGEDITAQDPAQIVQELLQLLGPNLAGQRQVIGFGVYIWNVTQTCTVLQLLRRERPQLRIVLGGLALFWSLALVAAITRGCAA